MFRWNRVAEAGPGRPLHHLEDRSRTVKSILFATVREDIKDLVDEEFLSRYHPIFLKAGHDASLSEPVAPIHLIVVEGYSIKEASRRIPQLEIIINELPPRLPRLYLLQDADPTLSPAALKGEQRFFYHRGPLSSASLKQAVDTILAPKPRARRVAVSPDQHIVARFSVQLPRAGVRDFERSVLEIGTKGFSFLWYATDPLIYPGDVLEDLELQSPQGRFLSSCARVRHLTLLKQESGEQIMRVGAVFLDNGEETADGGRSGADAFLSDALVIETVLNDAVERSTRVILRGEQPGWRVAGTMSSMDSESKVLTVTCEPLELPESLGETDIVGCQFVRDNAQLQFWSVVRSIDKAERRVVLRVPKRIDRLWARATLRYEFPEDEAPRVAIISPVTPNTPLVRPVVNLSPLGLRVQVQPDEDMLIRGMTLKKITLYLPEGRELELQGDVRYLAPVSPDDPTGAAYCGIRFRHASPASHHALVDFLVSKNYPNVKDAGPEDEEALWDFYRDADFFTPAKQASCIGTLEQVRETQRAILKADPPFSRRIVFRDNGRIYGTVSLLQICQRTWLVHHLCAVRHPREFVPKSLLLFLGEYISKTPEIHYIKMMWRPNNTWSNRMFNRLVHRLHDGEQSVVRVYSYLQRPNAPLPPVQTEGFPLVIRPIAGDEIAEVESYFIGQEEFFFMKSEDIFRGAYTLETVNRKFQALGLFRTREIFGAFDGDRLVGFSMAERASPGLNMSNLLTTFQVHICCPEHPRNRHIREMLIRYTTEYYQKHGQEKTVALTEDTDLSAYENLGFTKIKEYVSWTFDHNIANIYNLYNYYIFRIYERIESRRQELRTRHRR